MWPDGDPFEFSRGLIARLCPDSEDKLHRVFNGMDLANFSPVATPPQNAVPRIVSIGRLIEFKGFHHLIAACAELKRRGLPVNLALLNPVTSITLTFQRVFYGKAVVFGKTRQVLLPLDGPGWYLRNVLIVLAISAFLVLLSLWIFDRAEGNFAEAI